ncbi:GNAT family N-acetyltransferase/peptidase C39 family protein [Marinomonas ostreistagni]|uniref:GNAT family N-acetyltransferase/peptidase C39 family protein n=1 Tax=Marinomonas ostreistagni TaxID=359209 RepID=UPI0019514F15|nr:peptidase C39 family protein [Marinomonas ostreistagni]MBM6551973.1 peptidase C39 family protein [Marinomonas ostreistagni]
MAVEFQLRLAQLADLDALDALEKDAFKGDRMSRRSLRHAIKSDASVMLVAFDVNNALLGYALVHLFKGRAHARLYSLAVSAQARGKGVGKDLLAEAERQAAKHGCISLRLEVNEFNKTAISLYQKAGYRPFGVYKGYYEDHSNAVRMHKRIRAFDDQSRLLQVPYVGQRTPFTCGPASLLMVLAAKDEQQAVDLEQELDIWREATTIYMTSGHGGCHPTGLGLAAQRRGLQAEVWLNDDQPLFMDGVRDELKKTVLLACHAKFQRESDASGLVVHSDPLSIADVIAAVDRKAWVIVLISTYRLDGKKSPHWVVVTGYDEQHIYVHDPDFEEGVALVECQYVPVLKADFEKMSKFGRSKLRAAIVLS